MKLKHARMNLNIPSPSELREWAKKSRPENQKFEGICEASVERFVKHGLDSEPECSASDPLLACLAADATDITAVPPSQKKTIVDDPNLPWGMRCQIVVRNAHDWAASGLSDGDRDKAPLQKLATELRGPLIEMLRRCSETPQRPGGLQGYAVGAIAALQGQLLPLLAAKLKCADADVASKAARTGQAERQMAVKRAARVPGQQQLPDEDQPETALKPGAVAGYNHLHTKQLTKLLDRQAALAFALSKSEEAVKLLQLIVSGGRHHERPVRLLIKLCANEEDGVRVQLKELRDDSLEPVICLKLDRLLRCCSRPCSWPLPAWSRPRKTSLLSQHHWRQRWQLPQQQQQALSQRPTASSAGRAGSPWPVTA